MPISVLLGSGISIAAGMPGISEMTGDILDGMQRHTTYDYVKQPFYFTDIPTACAFIKLVKPLVDNYHAIFNNRNVTNYEDIFYIVDQIHAHELGNYDNPAIQPLVESIDRDRKQIPELVRHRRLIDVAMLTCDYITDCVWYLLGKKPTRTDHLQCIAEICKANKDVNIFTLNHDTILEEFLASKGIDFNDGFTIPDGEKCFNPRSLRQRTGVTLIKLHGSVGWFRRRKAGESWGETVFKVGQNGFERTKNKTGEDQWAIDGRPLLLIGNHNKVLGYTSYIFSHLYCVFHTALEESDRLMICGYGFCDKGVNSRVLEWMYEGQKSIVVVHKNPDELLKNGRFAMTSLEPFSSFKAIRKWMEPSLTWAEIESAFT